MIRRRFLKRMALAAAACAFIDVPWPREQGTVFRFWRPLDEADVVGSVSVTSSFDGAYRWDSDGLVRHQSVENGPWEIVGTWP